MVTETEIVINISRFRADGALNPGNSNWPQPQIDTCRLFNDSLTKVSHLMCFGLVKEFDK